MSLWGEGGVKGVERGLTNNYGPGDKHVYVYIFITVFKITQVD